MKYKVQLSKLQIKKNEFNKKWDELHYINVSDKSSADRYMEEEILDTPVYFPHIEQPLKGSWRQTYGQSSIDRQLEKFTKNIGILYFLTIEELPESEPSPIQ